MKKCNINNGKSILKFKWNNIWNQLTNECNKLVVINTGDEITLCNRGIFVLSLSKDGSLLSEKNQRK